MTAATGSSIVSSIERGPVLIVGTVTWDRFEDRTIAGGAVSYAALVAAAYGIRARLLVNAGDDIDVGPLDGHELHRVGEQTLVYEHSFSGRKRELRLLQSPDVTLGAAHAPAHWLNEASLLMLCPLLPYDIDITGLMGRAGECEVALLAQGLQRDVAADGRVQLLPYPAPTLLEATNERTSVFLSGDETAEWPMGAVEELASRARRVIVTRGREGADLYTQGSRQHIPAHAANRIDPTGAGDVFAAAFILAVRAGEQAAGRLASAFAAASVERRGLAPLPPISEIIATLDAPAAGGAEASERAR